MNSLENHPNLLWYTADKPDGISEPLNATTITYDPIYNLDIYHPVSLLVLNCQDYYWSSYTVTAGTDIMIQDAYMIGKNMTLSTVWNNRCTLDFGDWGCDKCKSIPVGQLLSPIPHFLVDVPANSGIGTYFDISGHLANFKNCVEVMGWKCIKAVLTVSQAFSDGGKGVVPVHVRYVAYEFCSKLLNTGSHRRGMSTMG
ncbi:hypothetical protein BDN67DRAFT_780532 [Paxillus ammoniavirescens]|nr:hypothetical protein BDN67DRAFT_780532 [Paxillus ammoniavirescens]